GRTAAHLQARPGAIAGGGTPYRGLPHVMRHRAPLPRSPSEPYEPTRPPTRSPRPSSSIDRTVGVAVLPFATDRPPAGLQPFRTAGRQVPEHPALAAPPIAHIRRRRRSDDRNAFAIGSFPTRSSSAFPAPLVDRQASRNAPAGSTRSLCSGRWS